MTVPDVIERRECPECGVLGKCPKHAPPGEPFLLPVTRRYVAVDALLRDDVVEAVAGMASPHLMGTALKPNALSTTRRALAAAVKHLESHAASLRKDIDG